MGRATLDVDRRVVASYVTDADLVKAGVGWGDIDNLIDLIRQAEEADAAILGKVHDDGRVKVSMRSRGETDVGSLAEAMGGGGHRLAAGFTTEGPVEEVLKTVMDSIEDYR
jgi:phosphoesterase RecJ-like protein